jgi:hypothetical protein
MVDLSAFIIPSWIKIKTCINEYQVFKDTGFFKNMISLTFSYQFQRPYYYDNWLLPSALLVILHPGNLAVEVHGGGAGLNDNNIYL